MSEHRLHAATWEDVFDHYVDRGYADDEIVDELNRVIAAGLRGGKSTRDGEYLEWISLRDRRRLMAMLASIRGDPVPADSRPPVAEPVRLKRGRPPLSETKVRADLIAALDYLRTRPDNPTAAPSWDAIAAAHSGYTEDETLTPGGLRHRRTRFPDLFRELVPWLLEQQTKGK